MDKRWVVSKNDDAQSIAHLQAELQINEVLAALLVKRNIRDFNSAKNFFRPQLDHLHDPFLMQDMQKAIHRIEKALQEDEKILIYGDYDVDGTTAVATVYSFFKRFHQNIEFYIPDRYLEGYGISTKGIDYAATNNFSLIIALDCGIKSVDKVDYANSLNIDFIICDHHLPGDKLPEAVAVLDPKRLDCGYPYKELSGCGIGFKLIQAYAIRNNILFSELECYLELVAISIASDIVPLTGENRVLAYYGLHKLNTAPCRGIAAMLEQAGKKNYYSISDVVFIIGPRINAAGRIDDAKQAVKLLIADDDEVANIQSKLIDTQNIERKGYDQRITEEALAILKEREAKAKTKTSVVFKDDWHKGVIGIVASRLTETYYRPTVVLTKSNGHVAGSARSVLDFDLYEALSACSDLLEQFGGHKYAAGLTMKQENISLFMERFEEVVSASIPDELLIQQIVIENELPLESLDARFYRILKQFSPFGPQNMAPTFLSKNVTVLPDVSIVGEKHLKFKVRQANSPVFECIGFNLASYFDLIYQNQSCDICYTIEENHFRDKITLQLNVKGIRRCQDNEIANLNGY